MMKSNPSAVFLFPSSHEILRNPDVHFLFRQESHFYYLTGFEEPESFLVLAPSHSKRSGYRTILFLRKRDAEKELWEGERYGTEGALKVFGVDEAYPIEDLETKLHDLFESANKIFYRLGFNSQVDRLVLSEMESYRSSAGRSGRSLLPIYDPNEVIGEMRLFKSKDELIYLRKACQVSALAHKTLMTETKPGMNECEVEALVDYSFRKGGCQRVGYGSIVAGGKNATCLHYRSNNETLKDGDLLLVDAGGEHNYYTADITRTFPVGKTFNEVQAGVYDLVLKSQKEAIAMVKPGAKISEIHKRVCEILTEGAIALGLLKGSRADLIKNAGFRRFYPHNTSHWLGMDVHDVGLYLKAGESKGGEHRVLEPGMVLTIEPGFYIQPGDPDAPAHYKGIGIRIEDDILVTEGGNENLTLAAPKERAEIEALKR